MGMCPPEVGGKVQRGKSLSVGNGISFQRKAEDGQWYIYIIVKTSQSAPIKILMSQVDITVDMRPVAGLSCNRNGENKSLQESQIDEL